ncbi:HD domain-containing protein [Staphylococcus sp. 17KM0847]|uniref:HD domain-containing protein n=1 Tax=Staphylococcus sp. 17KM0847 TaxID=2583989 RepID=UPI0015DCCC4F|nr:HD domain-containing protein [Staphylococcus sp. 17KM0847]QLK86498.1 HD domain-containing protein [Staphylococcus sp. 17KM0847]
MHPHIKAAYDYMKLSHAEDTTGHDIAHVKRVHHLAKNLAQSYPDANAYVIEMAALLHDTVDDKLVDSKTAYTSLQSFMDACPVSNKEQHAILYIIDNISFRKSKQVGKLQTLEAQIVQDADRLDAIGAIGIARTFQYSGHFNEPMWTDDVAPDELQKEVTHLSPSAIKHFYEKLLTLKNLMNTPEAQRIATQRHQFMKTFLQQFFDEWNSTDI